MRLLRLELRRYGHLTDTTLDFSGDAALHVVHGPNEAGKSTALAAIADAFFGIEDRSAYTFRYLGPQLRLAFALRAADGGVQSFVRRKGRKDTLSDEAGTVLPEDALRRFLGGATRDLFEKGFGLDGDRLRQGGLALLQSGGDVGGALMAGTGIGNLRVALQRLDEEAKTLSGARGKPRLQEAVKVWRAAQTEAAQRAVAPADWRGLETLRANAQQQLVDIRARTNLLSTEQSRLQRARRVVPLLHELSQARAAMAGLGDIPALPADAEARRQAALEMASDATRDTARETRQVDRLTADRDRLQRDPAVLAEQDVIDALAADCNVLAQALADLPGVRARVFTFVATTARALLEIGGTQTPEQARDGIPSAASQSRVRGLIAQRITATSRLGDAEIARAEAVRRRDAAKAKLAAMPVPPSASLLRRNLESVRAEGPIDAELARAARACAEADLATTRAVAALPLWHGTLADLLSCPVPLVADLEAQAARMAAASLAVRHLQAEKARLEAEFGTLTQAAEALAQGEAIPTPDAIMAARRSRDAAWRLIRREVEGGGGATPGDRHDLPSGPLPDVFEALQDGADRLADRASGEAERVARYLVGLQRLGDVTAAALAARTACEDAAGAAAAEDVAWTNLWAPSGLVPGRPAAMAEWRQKREAVVALAAQAEAADAVHAALRDRGTRAMARLDAALGASLTPVGATVTVADRLLLGDEICAAAEARVAAYQRLGLAVSDAEERLPVLGDAVAQAATAVTQWHAEWAGAVVGLGLPADASVEQAEAALAAWAEIAAEVTAWREDERRIVDMQARVDGDTHRLQGVLARLGDVMDDEAATISIMRLSRRLAVAREAEAASVAFDKQIRDHQAALAAARETADCAARELAVLCGMAGVDNDADLERVIARARRRESVATTLETLADSLRSQGDGYPEDALRQETAEIDVDAVKARLDEIAALLASYGAKREEHSALSSQAEGGLARMRDGHDAASKAQEAEDALAEARAAAERYARVHVARVLLRAGVERFRRDNQGPLLRAAGVNFALLTGGRYVGLGVDEDDKGNTELRAIRDDATDCPVHGLSEGTRDQLFLALRVAVVQAQASRGERLPFIADDLLVHFDDARAATAIQLLLQLGRTTQVILFTHHEHIAALARLQAGVVVQGLAVVG